MSHCEILLGNNADYKTLRPSRYQHRHLNRSTMNSEPPLLPSAQPQTVVVSTPKSVGLAFILTCLFGPLGMLYSTVPGALIMMGVGFVVGLVTFGVGLVLVWPVCIIWGCIAAGKPSTQTVTIVQR